ncbi:sensor histidine kinase [Trinickia sp.]|uniref:sensor histidine kinase n=1 Tax=Trinickia sp. TaxID=2571163 RepID=UPI0039C95093
MSTSFDAVSAATSEERYARMRAETALFMRDHLLSIVSHDLRSPLNAIHSWAYVLERKLDAGDTAAQRALAGIRSGVDQQVQLLEDAIDNTRAETKALPLQRSTFPMRPVLDRSLDDVRRALADARGVSIKIDSRLESEQCDGDRERFSQAVWVMLAFAVEASRPGTAVTLSSNVESGAWHVKVTHVMSFAALNDAELPHAFETAARKQAIQPREAGRISWVLALPQRVAAAHGGSFEQGEAVDDEPTVLLLRAPLVSI